jgi:hypothetical protein
MQLTDYSDAECPTTRAAGSQTGVSRIAGQETPGQSSGRRLGPLCLLPDALIDQYPGPRPCSEATG